MKAPGRVLYLHTLPPIDSELDALTIGPQRLLATVDEDNAI